ncbi:amino acid ABC transporter permease [Psychromarinibacter sp. C21-152]|uniref:Amino acid ABC transporter permease n=1 Tax=Psychromarinibacter sediminicola TaxID=3033385 RepID=A0AAE3NR93_9RHOB|nr:amino acid ABC transporter permease [Psychromarinibacter sediminicola]MDF0600981.1 amino acid ABC transporter permease [Psychromarinibacter sediminicola]
MNSETIQTHPSAPGSANDESATYFPVYKEKSRWSFVVGTVAILILAGAFYGLVTNQNMKWSVFLEYLFSGPIMSGLIVTIELSAFALAVGLALGIFVALGRMSDNIVISNISAFYVWVLRGLPAIVQLLIWGNIGLFVPVIVLGVPFTDIALGEVRVATYLTPFVASFVALGLAESAYMGEIIRGGLQSIDSGQREAAFALGMRRGRILRRIILPQAMRAIVPSLGNQFSNIIKASALVSVIAGGDLLTTAQNIAGQNYRVMEMLFVASFWYLAILAVMSPVQHLIEKRTRRMDR